MKHVAMLSLFALLALPVSAGPTGKASAKPPVKSAAKPKATLSPKLKALIGQLKAAKTPKERKAAVDQIGALRDPAAIPTLLDALKPMSSDSNQDWFVGVSAATALSKIGKPAIEPLKQHLQDPNMKVRNRVVTALSLIRPPDIEQILTSRLKNDPAPQVRITCLRKLRKLGLKSALPALREAAKSDKDEAVRERAARAADRLEAAEPDTAGP